MSDTLEAEGRKQAEESSIRTMAGMCISQIRGMMKTEGKKVSLKVKDTAKQYSACMRPQYQFSALQTSAKDLI